jgi:hypothetical protein
MIKSVRMRWAGHIAGMQENRNACGILVRKPEENIPRGRPRGIWEGNILIDLREREWRYGLYLSVSGY